MSHNPTAPDDRFRIYKSSAGSGKTFTLVVEYISLVLLRPDRWRSVLAVTFTNKAANEMKSRIIDGLAEISRGENEQLHQKVQERTGLPMQEVPIRCKDALALILHDYGRFAVSTIDAFTNRVVRTFGQDLGVASGFEIESDADALKELVVDQLMDNVGRNDFVTRILTEFTADQLEQEKDWRIERQLSEVASTLFRDSDDEAVRQLNAHDEKDFEALILRLKKIIRAFEASIAEVAKDIVSMTQAEGFSLEDFPYKSTSYFSGPLALSKDVSFDSIRKGHGKMKKGRLRNVIVDDNENDWIGAKHDRRTAYLDLLDAGLREAYKELYDRYAKGYNEYVTAYRIYSKAYSTAVLSEMEQAIEAYKEEENKLLFADLNRKISGFISEEDQDYLYWRLGEQYQHFLLDEFQDTSRLQWENFEPLFDHVRSGGAPEGTVFLVGDTKQAIYRWRGGDSALMEQVAPLYFDTLPDRLATNYRSKAGIVSFNNAVFSSLKDLFVDHPLIPSIYDEPSQEIAPHLEEGGYVKVEFLDIGIQGLKRNTPERLPGLVREILADGFTCKDIGILVRTGKAANAVAQALNQEGIPIISQDSLLIASHPSVRFVMTLLKTLSDPRDELALVEVLYRYLQMNGVEEGKIQDKLMSLSQAEDPRSFYFESMPEALKSLDINLSGLPVYELVENVIRIFHLNDSGGAYVQKLLEEVVEVSERRGPDLGTFLEHWEDKSGEISIAISEDTDAVRILTIHKAKGLEFPVVILPVTDWELKPRHTSTFWAESPPEFREQSAVTLLNVVEDLKDTPFEQEYQREVDQTVLESVNMLYVALTRPKERMYIFCKNSAPRDGNLHTADKILYSILHKPPFELKENRVEWGKKAPGPHAGISTQDHANAKLISNDWKKTLTIRAGYLDYWYSKDIGGKMGLPIEALLKKVLVQCMDIDTIPVKIRQLVNEGLARPEQIVPMQEKLDHLKLDANFQRWFDQRHTIRLEPEISLAHGNRIRVDRLVASEGQLDIILFQYENEKDKRETELKKFLDQQSSSSPENYKVFVVDLGKLAVRPA